GVLERLRGVPRLYQAHVLRWNGLAAAARALAPGDRSGRVEVILKAGAYLRTAREHAERPDLVPPGGGVLVGSDPVVQVNMVTVDIGAEASTSASVSGSAPVGPLSAQQVPARIPAIDPAALAALYVANGGRAVAYARRLGWYATDNRTRRFVHTVGQHHGQPQFEMLLRQVL